MPNSWLTLAQLDRQRLESNLSVLKESQPNLVSVIERERDRTDILVRPVEKGFYQCKRIEPEGETWFHGEQAVNQEIALCRRGIQDAFDQGAWLVLVYGVGLGYVVQEMAIQLEMQRRGEPKGMICLKRDPGLVYAAFSLFDFSIPLRTGRILWVIGEDLDQQLQILCRDHHLETLDPQQIRIVSNNSPSSDQAGESGRTAQQAIQVFWDTHRTLRNQYFQVLRTAEEYWSQKTWEINRVWTHFNTDRGGAEMMMGLLEGFRESGLETRAPHMTDRFFTRFYRIAADFYAFHPDLLLSQNHSSNYSVSFAQPIPIPRAIWFVDDPENMANIPFHPLDRIFSVSPQFAMEIERRGKNVERILHAAASSDLTPPISPVEWRHSVSYVGAVTDNRHLLDEIPSAIRDRLERAIAEMQFFPLRADIRQTLVQAFDPDQIAQMAKILTNSIPKARFMTPEQTLLYFIYMEANTRRRVQALSSLDEVEGLGIYGPPAWKELLPTETLKDAYRGSIDTRSELLELYRTSCINLCINSLQGFGFLNTRVFDVPAAGGFVLAEWTPLLPKTFQNDECIWFRTIQEMRNSIQRYIHSDDERIAIIRRAQERIRSEHTYRHRAQEILETLSVSCDNA